MASFQLSYATARGIDEFYSDLMVRAEEYSYGVQEAVLDEAKTRAQSSERWSGLVDEIDTWTEYDRFWVGVRGVEYVSDAFAAEYGTESYPPEPLLRTLDEAYSSASKRHMMTGLGLYRGVEGW